MNITTHREADATPFETPTESATRPSQGSPRTQDYSFQMFPQIWSRRRWAGVSAIAVALLLALLLDSISGRTALMAAGTLLAFALSADRLDQIDE